jgi:hypothetical protein
MPRRVSLLVVIAFALVIGLDERSQAVDLGTYTGKSFDVPQATCHPHCKILGGGNLEGDYHTFTDSFPSNVRLDSDTAQIQCLGTPCVFDKWGITVDNLDHTASIWILSHSASVKITWNAKLASAGALGQLPSASEATPPPGLAATARDHQLKVIGLIRDYAIQICGTVPLEGTDAGVKLSANASAKVSGLIGKLFSAEAGANTESEHYIGVLQQDLPNAILNNTNCRLAVFNVLLAKLVRGAKSRAVRRIRSDA